MNGAARGGVGVGRSELPRVGAAAPAAFLSPALPSLPPACPPAKRQGPEAMAVCEGRRAVACRRGGGGGGSLAGGGSALGARLKYSLKGLSGQDRLVLWARTSRRLL